MQALTLQDLPHEHTLDRAAARDIRGGVSYDHQYESTTIRVGEPQPRPSRPFPFSIFDSMPFMPMPPGMDLPSTPAPVDPCVRVQVPTNPVAML